MARSPQVGVTKRRFKNVTPEIHGAVILDADQRAKGVAVDPGEEIWLSEVEEQLTAEAPVSDQDNPFIKQWEKPVGFDEHGNPTSWEPRTGCLLMIDAEPRIIGSRRFTPTHGDPDAAIAAQEPAPEPEAAPEPDPPAAPPAEPAGAAPAPVAPPVEGQLQPDESVGTPEAVTAHNEHEAKKAETEAKELTAEEAEARAKAIAEGEPGRDRGGIDWGPGQPTGAPAKDKGAESRKPVATQG